MRKRNWKSLHPTCLDEAIELSTEHAAEKLRRPAKVMADLMGVELKTYYRWLADSSMPLNRIRQFEEFAGTALISKYLCLAHGDKVVIDVPAGRKASVADLTEVQASFAEAMSLLVRFYQCGDSLDETVAAISKTLAQLAYQRENVLKTTSPELSLFGGE